MGRPKGAKNKRSLKVEEIAARFDIDPFEVLMMIAAGDWKGLGFEEKTHTTFTPQGIEVEEENVPVAQRCMAAREAVKYLHTQKHHIRHEISEEEFKGLLRERILMVEPLLLNSEND